MAAGVGDLRPPVINIQRGSDVDLPIDIPLSAPATTGATITDLVSVDDETHANDCGTQPEDPHDDIV